MERRAPKLTFVVPTYNERETLPDLIEALAHHVKMPYEILVVDDASPDGTADIAEAMSPRHPVRVLRRPEKRGLGSAYRDGFANARGDIIFEMDADLSHDPRHVDKLAQAVADGAAIAVGSRYIEGGRVVGWGRYRQLVSHVGNGLARLVLGLPTRDVTSGYRCYARAHARLVQEVGSDGYAFQVETLYLAKRSGLIVHEVPITFENRTMGTSKLGMGEFVKFLFTLLRLRLTGARRSTRAGRFPAP